MPSSPTPKPVEPQLQPVVIYARVSSKDQEREGFSIPAQLDLLRSYAGENGFAVAQEFIDVETAKAAGRTGFGAMIAFLKKSPTVRVVLVEKTDRLYRNFRDYVTIDELGLEVRFVKENVVLSPDSRSHEKFLHGIKVLMAKNYVDNLSEETRKGMLEKARQGIWPSCAPLGYLNVVGPDGKRTIVPDPTLAPIIRDMFERYATGKLDLKEVVRLAHADGLAYRKSGAVVARSSVHKILRNRIYSGDFDFDGITYNGVYEPIVSRQLWQQVQQILSNRGTRKTRKTKQNFAFSGLITCGHCGCALVGELKKGRYVYYHCTGYKGKCAEPYTREEVLEEKFGELLKALTFSDDVLDWVATALLDGHADERKAHDEAITRLQREHRRIQERIDCMYVDKLDGRIDNDFFDRNATKFRVEQDQIMEDIAAHQRATESWKQDAVRVLDAARRARAMFADQPAAEKRKLLDFVFSSCRWKNGKLEVEYRRPFDMLAAPMAA